MRLHSATLPHLETSATAWFAVKCLAVCRAPRGQSHVDAARSGAFSLRDDHLLGQTSSSVGEDEHDDGKASGRVLFTLIVTDIATRCNAVQLSHIAATHRLEIRGNGGCAKIEAHSN